MPLTPNSIKDWELGSNRFTLKPAGPTRRGPTRCPRVIEDLYSDLNVSNLYLKRVNANMANTMQKAILTILDESTELILKVW